MKSQSLGFPMYFRQPSHFLTKADIDLAEILRNDRKYISAPVWFIEVCIFNRKAVLKQFFMIILQLSKKMTEAPSIAN